METAAITAPAGEAIESVYRQEADRLWRSLYAYAADSEIASDAVAEAFAQAIRRGPAVRDARAGGW